jgi:hypothetical protein
LVRQDSRGLGQERPQGRRMRHVPLPRGNWHIRSVGWIYLIETSEERACLRNGLACPALPPRLEATFRFAVIVELALKRRLPTFLGGPFGGMVPI